MSKMQGTLIQTNDDGSMTVYLCKKYNTFADILLDENPPQYALCVDTGVYYKRNDDGTWPEAVEALQWTYSEIGQGQNPSITLQPGLLANPLHVILTDTASDLKGNTIGWSSPDWLSENIVQGKNIFGIAGSAQASAFGISKVNEFQSYRAEMTDVSQVVISGLGFYAYDPEYEPDWGTDLAPLNGTYVVTEDTKYNTHQNRVYKQVDGPYLLAYYRAQEYDDFYDHWFISKSLSWHGYSANMTCSTDTLFNAATHSWEFDQMMYGGTVTPTIALTQTTYPEQQFKLSGYDLTEYDTVMQIPTVSGDLTVFTDAIVTPVKGSFYIRKGTILIGSANIPDSTFLGSCVLFALDASIGVNDLIADLTPTVFGNGDLTTVHNGGEFVFDNKRALDYSIGSSMESLQDFTIEMDYTITSDATGYCGFVGNKRSWSSMCICIQWGRDGRRPAMFWNDYFDTNTGGPTHDDWVNDGVYHHVAFVRKGSTVSLYSDGERIATYSGATIPLNLAVENLLCVGAQHVEDQILPGRMKHFRVLNRAVYDGDVYDIPAWVGMDTSGIYDTNDSDDLKKKSS